MRAEGAVEVWLLSFEQGMRQALYDQSKAAVQAYPPTDEGSINRAEWLWAYCAQVVISIDQVTWTMGCQKALMSIESGADVDGMKHFLDFSLKQIDAMVDLVRTNLTKHQRTLMGALLTIDVHARDVVRTVSHIHTHTLSLTRTHSLIHSRAHI